MKTHKHHWYPMGGILSVFHYRTNWYRRIVMICRDPYHNNTKDWPMLDHFWKQIGPHWEHVTNHALLKELYVVSTVIPPDKVQEFKVTQ